MKLSDLTFIEGCGCCHVYEEAKFQAGDASIVVMLIPQEEGPALYTVLIDRPSVSQERHFKLDTDSTEALLASIA
ncbi:hypothetical protein GTP58_24485 [Duganella sp. CY15W]|uniref:hypothetical protein n=1 Tax=Duganella sp. CY15W TaxID=2692172 RepID=UPI00137032A3|nr:hypothetical protein [Duganella sp. CY15W]MYM31496.1 hypothetical protein [Duganella sp. CY15W]